MLVQKNIFLEQNFIQKPTKQQNFHPKNNASSDFFPIKFERIGFFLFYVYLLN